jgi:hypothetical protein
MRTGWIVGFKTEQEYGAYQLRMESTKTALALLLKGIAFYLDPPVFL